MYCSECGAMIPAGAKICANCGTSVMDFVDNPLLRRALLFLEESDWGKANDYCERVLDTEPENAMAYVIKLLIRAQVKSLEELRYSSVSFATWNSYQNACRYADGVLRSELESCLENVEQRIHYCEAQLRAQEEIAAQERAQARVAEIYWQACNLKDRNYEAAIKLFEQVRHYKDAAQQADRCKGLLAEQRRREIERQAESELAAEREEKRKKVIIVVSILAVVVLFAAIIGGINTSNAARAQRIDQSLTGLKFTGKYIDGRTTKGGAIEAYEEMTEYEVTYTFLDDDKVQIHTVERYDDWPFITYNGERVWDNVTEYTETVHRGEVSVSFLGAITLEIGGSECVLTIDGENVPRTMEIGEITYQKCD